MPRFLIQNSRPRKHVTLFGRVLRAARPGLKQSVGELWVTEDEIIHPQVISLLRLRRIRIADFKDVDAREVEAFLASIHDPEESRPSEAPAPAPAPVEEPSPAVQEDEAEVVVEESSEPVSSVPVDPEPVGDTPLGGEGEVSREEPEAPKVPNLNSMKYRELQALAREEGVNAAGKRTDLVNRLTAHFESKS